jgi:glycosyltransferase involved in cell wall biosynthesis
MILFLHNRYRVPGGEERVVDDLMWLVRERLGEPAELLARGGSDGGSRAQVDSSERVGSRQAGIRTQMGGRTRAAAGMLRGGLGPREVGDAVRLTGARVVHAHNLNPGFGWRALAAARGAGARVVVHLHQYRLVCAVGVCFTQGEECVRCHGRNTLPGVVRNCRGGRVEALVYGAGLALWQRRVVEQADAVIVPSEFARERLRELGAPLPWERVHVLAPPVRALEEPSPAVRHAAGEKLSVAPPALGGYALVVARMSPEKGIDVAIEACRRVGIPLVIAGEGLDRDALAPNAEARVDASAAAVGPRSNDGAVRYVGRVEDARLAELRAGAALGLVPSRSAETFGLAAAEAMAAGLPVAGSRVGALPELLEEQCLATPGDADALAAAIERVRGDPRAGERALERVRARCSPEVVAGRLAEIYEGATALHYARS